MKALLLDGSLAGDDSLSPVHEAIVEHLEAGGWSVEPLMLRHLEIGDCLGCFGCWVRTPGVCVIDDSGREVAERMAKSDLVIYLSPVTFGGYSSELKKALDRAIPLVLPFFIKIDGEIHHPPRYEHKANVAAFGVLQKKVAAGSRMGGTSFREGVEESGTIFATLFERNAINLHAKVRACEVLCLEEGMETVKERIKAALEEVTK